MERYLKKPIADDLKKKMVFLGGPRQVGKTTLANSYIRSARGYLNWDIAQHRELILRNQVPSTPLIVLDELHKFKGWRNFLKGLYDGSRDEKQKILVTGSARLDFYRRGGDSLQGRYFFYRLHPLSVAELGIRSQGDFDQLMRLGGFPEPFLSGSERDAKRWSLDYRTRLIREDLASLERIEDLGNLELMLLRLPDLVGSPLSLNALREDLQVSHHSVRRWLDALERLFAFFRIPPFGAPRIRAVKKEQKHYHFDWTLVTNEGLRFENMVACSLLKWCHFKRDVEGEEWELRYFRDIDKREVDFVLMLGKAPMKFIECKISEESPSRSLLYLHQRFPQAEAWQISARGTRDVRTTDGVRLAPAITFLQGLI